MKTRDLSVAQLVAKPGEKKNSLLDIPLQNFKYSIPVFAINGVNEGPTLVVTAGVHAAEYASIQAALDLGRSLKPEEVQGQVIVVPVVNTPGFGVRSIYQCPLDGKNLNRVFPGKSDGSASEQIAHWLFQNIISQADYYIDLHGGDLIEALIPFSIVFMSGNEKIDAVSKEMAEVFGIKNIVRSETKGSVYSAAALAGIPSILSEAGGQGIWLPKDIKVHSLGLKRIMRHFGLLRGPKPRIVQTHLLNQFIWLRSEHEGYWYPEVPVGEKVIKGQLLGCIKDTWGDILQTINAPANGEVLFLVSSLAINNGDPLLSIGV